MYHRAVMHQNGQGGAVDLYKAAALYDRAITLGHTDAMSRRACMHQKGEGGEVNLPAAIRLYHQLIPLNDEMAMLQCAIIYEETQTDEPGIKTAIKLYEKAIALGNIDAITRLARIYQKGKSGQVNLPAAIELYEQAIKLGNADAMYHRARMHQNGHGGPIDMKKAARLYRRAAEKKHTEADNTLKNQQIGIFNYHHRMCLQDTENAAKIVTADCKLLTEFIEFDCKYMLCIDACHLKYIEDFINQYCAINEDGVLQSKLELVLIALNDCETAFNGKIIDLMQLKINCLLAMKIIHINNDNISTIMLILTNTWYYVTTNQPAEEAELFTREIYPIIRQAMYKLMLSGGPAIENAVLKNMAIIILKNMYGSRCSINMNDVSIEQVMILIAHHENPVKISIGDMNKFLGGLIISPIAVKRTVSFFGANSLGLALLEAPCQTTEERSTGVPTL